VPSAGVCASVAIGSDRGPVRTCALLGAAFLLLWAVALIFLAFSSGRRRRLGELYLDSLYGAPVRGRSLPGEEGALSARR
jgi:hypothetical protein